MRVLSLFSGIGAFESALENLKIPFELVAYSEIDPFASKAYALLHNVSEKLNLGDISKIDETRLPGNIDLLTYGFPCQDISIAGKQKGFVDEHGETTRSGLFFDAVRIIRAVRPRVAIAENVKNLTSKSMRPIFDVVLRELSDAGYVNYWNVLNCADYEIPQHRERILIVSIRKDVDTGYFAFPQPVPLNTCMGDWLDNMVPESYYLSDEQIERVVVHNAAHAGQLCERGAMYNIVSQRLQRSEGGD